MDTYYLTKEEDEELQFSIMLPRMRYLYEYFCRLPLNDLRAYPEKGYRDRMGPEARSAKALEMRDYILFWRLAAQRIRKQYSYEYLKSLPVDSLRSLLDRFYRQTPLWAYDGPISDIIRLLCI